MPLAARPPAILVSKPASRLPRTHDGSMTRKNLKKSYPQPRQPKGTNKGGQFAEKTQAAATLDLEEGYPPFEEPDRDLWNPRNPFPEPGQPAPDYLLARYSPDYDTWGEVFTDVARETNRNTSHFRSSARQDFRDTVVQETLLDISKQFSDAINGIEAGVKKTAPARQDGETSEAYSRRRETWRRNRIRHVAQQTRHVLLVQKIKGHAIRVDIHQETGTSHSRKLSGSQITGRKLLIAEIDAYREQHGQSPSTKQKQEMWARIRAEGTDSFRRHTGIDDWAVSGLIYDMRNMPSLDARIGQDDNFTLGDTIAAKAQPGMTPAEIRCHQYSATLPAANTPLTVKEIRAARQEYADGIGLELHERKLAGFRNALVAQSKQVVVEFPAPGTLPKPVAQTALNTIQTVDDLEQAITDCARHRDTRHARALMSMWTPPTGDTDPDSIYETDQAYETQEKAWGQTSDFFAWLQHQPTSPSASFTVSEANPVPYDPEQCLRFWRSKMVINAGMGEILAGWRDRFAEALACG